GRGRRRWGYQGSFIATAGSVPPDDLISFEVNWFRCDRPKHLRAPFRASVSSDRPEQPTSHFSARCLCNSRTVAWWGQPRVVTANHRGCRSAKIDSFASRNLRESLCQINACVFNIRHKSSPAKALFHVLLWILSRAATGRTRGGRVA